MDAPARTRGRHPLLLLALLTQLAIGPFLAALPFGEELSFAIGVLLLATLLWAVADSRPVLVTAVVLITGSALTPFVAGDADLSAVADSGLHVPVFCFAAWVVTSRVLRADDANLDTIAGSLCAYLMIALAFAGVFSLLESHAPGSLTFARGRPDEGLLADLFYFSLVTITTLGYGDITPVSGAARSLATLESVIGILYPSIVVARLVGLAASGGGRPFALADSAGFRRGRFELLTLLALGLLVAGPLLPPSGFAVQVLRVLTTAMLLAALYAGGAGRWQQRVALLLAALAVLGEWFAPLGSDAGAGPVAVVGMAAESAFLLLVCSSLLLWLAREPSVTRDVLLASLAVFLLIGFGFASAFGLVEALAPGSVLVPEALASARGQLSYFSFMTLTTTGYGDVAPLSPVVQRLAMLESFVGVFYPPVLVGRLVSLYRADEADAA